MGFQYLGCLLNDDNLWSELLCLLSESLHLLSLCLATVECTSLRAPAGLSQVERLGVDAVELDCACGLMKTLSFPCRLGFFAELCVFFRSFTEQYETSIWHYVPCFGANDELKLT